MDLIYSTAHATVTPATDAPAPPGPAASLLPIVLLALVFYFLMIRPQQKRYKEHQNMVKALKKGDKVVTSGGLVGTIVKVDEAKDLLHLEVAEDVKVKVVRSMISGQLNTQEVSAPAKAEDKKAA